MAESTAAMPDAFDRLLGMLVDLPDVVKTKPSTIRTVPTLGVGGTTLHIIQTIRQQQDGGKSRDTIFLEHVSADGTVRLAIPPEVADVIARQRDALGTQVRKKTARRLAAERKERGEVPGFLRNRKRVK